MWMLFSSMPHALQALIATLFTWGLTALGAAAVFLFRQPDKRILNGMLGFAGGVMLAASYWSLLEPGAAMCREMKMNAWVTLCSGFLSGGALLALSDRIYCLKDRANGQYPVSSKRCAMLLLSITIHNIPEGMAVGVAFGSLAYGLNGAALSAACMLAVGIGLQNIPEGMAISVPMLREGRSKANAFFWGQLSGAVEPISGLIGALLVLGIRTLMPFMLSFAAGAMVFVVSEELIPESQNDANKSMMTLFTMAGFALMTALDVAFG